MYKNPKKPKASPSGVNDDEVTTSKGKGPSAMQPAASGVDGVKLVKGVEATEKRVNEEAWWKRKVEDVSVDQVGFEFLRLCF